MLEPTRQRRKQRWFKRWNQILHILDRLKELILLCAVFEFGSLRSAHVQPEEHGYGLTPSAFSVRIDSIDVETTRLISHTFASASNSSASIEDWFADLPRVTRNKIDFYKPFVNDFKTLTDPETVPNHDFLVTVAPLLGDQREALLITVVDDPTSKSLGYGSTNHALHFIRKLGNTEWLAKTIYFLILREGNQYNAGVKRFADWYLYGEGYPLRRFNVPLISSMRGEPLRRRGIIRQSVNIATSDSRARANEKELALHSNKVGPRNANLDFVTASLWISPELHNWSASTAIVKEINNDQHDIAIPHVYLNTLLIDSFTLELDQQRSHLGDLERQLFEKLVRYLRGCNQMTLNFHHLSSQYWLEPYDPPQTESDSAKKNSASPKKEHRQIGAAQMLLPLILLCMGFLFCTYTKNARANADADYYLWRSRQELYRATTQLKHWLESDEGKSAEAAVKAVHPPEPVTATIASTKEREATSEPPIYLHPAIPSTLEALPYQHLGDLASSHIAIFTVTAGAAAMTVHMIRLMTPQLDFDLMEGDSPGESALRSHLLSCLGSGLAIFFVLFSAFDVIARFTRESSALSPSLRWRFRMYAEMAARALLLPILISIYACFAMQPALGLLAGVVVPVVTVLPPPLDWAVAGALVSGQVGEYLRPYESVWPFSAVLRGVAWSRLLSNTYRPYGWKLTDDTAYIHLISIIVFMCLRSGAKAVTTSFDRRNEMYQRTSTAVVWCTARCQRLINKVHRTRNP